MAQPIAPPQPVLAAVQVSKRFGSHTAVHPTCVAVHASEIVGLLGPNGAGKSTLFQLLAGLTEPDTGQIMLQGTPITHAPLHIRAQSGLGYLPQGASVFPTLTTAENLHLACQAHRMPPSQSQQRAFELMAQLDLLPLAQHAASTLSGGQRRRLELARLLVQPPHVLLLDEPFAGVDPVAVAGIIDVIRDLAQQGMAVVITDHHVREALRVCHRACMMHQGQVMAEGSPDTVLADPHVRQVYLGSHFHI